MATQALIEINGTAGSNTDLPLNTLVNLTNDGAGGETTWEWTLLSQPEGATVNFVGGTLVSTLAAPQFIPTKEGSYLIRLIVNKGLVDEKTDTVIGAVLELQTGNRIPAALETTEVDSSYGWSYSAVDEILQRVTRQTDAGVWTCLAGENLSPGTVVHLSAMTEIAAGLPGARYIPTVNKATALTIGEVDGPLAVVVGQRDGKYLPVSTGDYCRVMVIGGLSKITLAGSGSPTPVAGDPIYVDDTGALSTDPGTWIRQVGDIAAVYAGPVYDVSIAAVSNSIPRGNADGDLAGYYPDPTIAALAVTESKIGTGAVTETKIGTGAVTETKIGTGAVTATKIGSSAVEEAKIASAAVTASKIGYSWYFHAIEAGSSTTSITNVQVAQISGAVFSGSVIKLNLQPYPGAANEFELTAANSSGTDHLAYLQIDVVGPVSRTFQYRYSAPKSATVSLPPLHIADIFPAGTYTITMYVRTNNTNVTITWDDLVLIAYQP